nr:hypothetical protein CFP56_43805 [Quercus suber]
MKARLASRTAVSISVCRKNMQTHGVFQYTSHILRPDAVVRRLEDAQVATAMAKHNATAENSHRLPSAESDCSPGITQQRSGRSCVDLASRSVINLLELFANLLLYDIETGTLHACRAKSVSLLLSRLSRLRFGFRCHHVTSQAPVQATKREGNPMSFQDHGRDHEHSNDTQERSRKKSHRSIVRVACNACRTRKIGVSSMMSKEAWLYHSERSPANLSQQCDASRPICATCRNSARKCVYDTQNDEETRAMALRRENAHLQLEIRELRGVLQSLTRMPDDEVLNYVRQYPTTAAVQSASQLATSFTNRLAWSDTQQPLDHPELYPNDQIPPLLPSIDTPALLPNSQNGLSPTTIQYGVQNAATFLPSIPPGHAELMNNLNVAFWTRVPIPGNLAASATALFLSTVDHSGGYFDAELFLMDFVAQESRYCSRLMASSLLFVACVCNPMSVQLRHLLMHSQQMFASFDPRAGMLSPQFLVEAKSIINVQKLPDEYCTVAALLLLGLGCSGSASEEAFAYRGCEMAQRLETAGDLHDLAGALTLEAQRMHRFKTRIITSASNVSLSLAVTR